MIVSGLYNYSVQKKIIVGGTCILNNLQWTGLVSEELVKLSLATQSDLRAHLRKDIQLCLIFGVLGKCREKMIESQNQSGSSAVWQHLYHADTFIQLTNFDWIPTKKSTLSLPFSGQPDHLWRVLILWFCTEVAFYATSMILKLSPTNPSFVASHGFYLPGHQSYEDTISYCPNRPTPFTVTGGRELRKLILTFPLSSRYRVACPLPSCFLLWIPPFYIILKWLAHSWTQSFNTGITGITR